MDKYEFNIKVEQMKKMVNKGDYATAMKIADTVDWRRVRNASLLSLVAQVYERNEEYQEAKDILLLAFERAPIGKRLLYKLTELALKEGSIAEAEAYYREFCDLAQDDPRQYLLRYLILKAKKAPADQLIRALETYTAIEVDEKWLFELAELYHQANMEDECVGACDKIMLLFGLGKYVDKAMDLKLTYAPLNKYQMDLVENRDKYEAKLRATEDEYSSAPGLRERRGAPKAKDYDEPRGEESWQPEETLDKEIVMKLHEAEEERRLAAEMSKISEDDPRTAQVEEDDMDATRTLDDLRLIRNMRPTEYASPAVPERKTIRDEEGREIERQREAIRAAKEREEMEADAMRRAEEEMEAARRAEEERRARKQAEIDRERARRAEKRRVVVEDEDPTDDSDDEEFDEAEDMPDSYNLMIEAESAKEGLSLALEALKKIHRELGYKNPVAKISSEKLNAKGVFAVLEKLIGKDLIVEDAAGLAQETLDDLDELMEREGDEMIVVLIDAPARLEELHRCNPSLAEKFQYIGTDEQEEYASETEAAVEQALKKETRNQEKIAEQVTMTAGVSDSGDEAADGRGGERCADADDDRAADGGGYEGDNRGARGEDYGRTADGEDYAEDYGRAADGEEYAEGYGRDADGEEYAEDYGRDADGEEYAEDYGRDADGEEYADDDRDAGGVEDSDWEDEPEPGDDRETGAEPKRKPGFFRKKRPADFDEEEIGDERGGRAGAPAPIGRVKKITADGAGVQGRETDARDGEKPQKKPQPQKQREPERVDNNAEMDLDEFAQYACKYASEIDCSITGKSMLALYERIEMMEEDGVRLTRAAAIDLIEEAADKAENPSFMKKLTGIFSAKYDKEGLLVLRENDFFD